MLSVSEISVLTSVVSDETVSPVVSVLFGYNGITMTRMTDEEYEALLRTREEEKKIAMAAMEA